ncbi:MAG: DUF922 domain-containing protein [Myxococcota bacterium]
MSVSLTGFDHSVTWRQFQRVASRPENVSEDAEIKARKHVSYDFGGPRGNYSVTAVRGRVFVNRAASWVVTGKTTGELLAHEQAHFDITALGMREEAKRVSELTGTSQQDLNTQYQEIRSEINANIAAANARYDTRTDHGNNKPAQRRWLRSIQSAKSNDGGTIDDLPG